MTWPIISNSILNLQCLCFQRFWSIVLSGRPCWLFYFYSHFPFRREKYSKKLCWESSKLTFAVDRRLAALLWETEQSQKRLHLRSQAQPCHRRNCTSRISSLNKYHHCSGFSQVCLVILTNVAVSAFGGPADACGANSFNSTVFGAWTRQIYPLLVFCVY